MAAAVDQSVNIVFSFTGTVLRDSSQRLSSLDIQIGKHQLTATLRPIINSGATQFLCYRTDSSKELMHALKITTDLASRMTLSACSVNRGKNHSMIEMEEIVLDPPPAFADGKYYRVEVIHDAEDNLTARVVEVEKALFKTHAITALAHSRGSQPQVKMRSKSI